MLEILTRYQFSTSTKKDVLDFMEELRTYHAEFADCFQRSEPRENFFHYMVGQFSEMGAEIN